MWSAVFRKQRNSIDVLRRFINVMLMKRDPANSCRVTLHDQRTILEIGKDVIRNLEVVTKKIRLCITFIRPVNAIEAGEIDRVFADLYTNVSFQILFF